jgi:tetratricopeptide (TPR) repeat protein
MRRWPLIVAAAGFVLYLATQGGGMTVNTVATVARLGGWDSLPLVGQPLLWLLTLPLQLLPQAWLAPAVKLLAAVLAAVILGLLARTLQLMPWDRAWDNTGRWTRALPVLAGCALCGLEFSFWQNATSECGELTALLPLAATIWLLMEYNARQSSRWLEAAVVVWGLGMAENWMMLAIFPIAAWKLRRQVLAWLMGSPAMRRQSSLRFILLALLGFATYMVLPLANGLAPHSPLTLEQSWLASLRETKAAMLVPYHFWRANRLLTIAITLFFLVPCLPLLVRLRDEGTGNKFGVDRLQTWLYRGLRLILLLACCWLALDPLVGPRQMLEKQMGVWSPMLTFDYLNALGAAFLLGNLLLISLPEPGRNEYDERRAVAWKPWVIPIVAILAGGTVAGLVIRNAPAIVRLNFHPIDEFGVLAAKSLPAGGGVVLSDFPDKLVVFQAGLARSHQTAEWLPVDTRALPTVEYRARLERRRPCGWLTDQTRHQLTPLEILRLLQQVARTNRLFYLHPSYGYFFESFYLEPTGPVFEMKPRGKDPMAVPPMTDALVTANEHFWTGVWDRYLAPLAIPAPHRPNYLQQKLKRLAITPVPNKLDRVLAAWYSLALDDWGVRLQRQGRLPEARVRLQQAVQLNTNNVAARLNLACNAQLAATNAMGLGEVGKVAGELGKPDRLNALINAGGPFDDPTLVFLLGVSFMDQELPVQAAEQFERAHWLAPGSLAPELALAQIYNRLHMADRSRPLINHLRQESAKLPDNRSLDLNLALLDSYAWLQQTNAANAREALQSLIEQHPDDPQINNRVLAAYIALGDTTNALQLADVRLAQSPDDVNTLNNKAMIWLQTGRAADAIALLNHVLELTNLPTARINRAYAGIACTNFSLAESDLRELEKEGFTSPMVSFGLATVAEYHHDTNQTVLYLQRCLSNSPAGGSLWLRAKARLSVLQKAPATTP